ncbi:MAG: ABC transporter ATP-binding protein [Gammaproteobacteria bacterium]|nr:ABC transporter ATP-binding protein [Gammaproteobacteria bacterium]
MTAAIALHRVSKSYRNGAVAPPVLRQLDLEIATGTFAVLFGRSGSGKSTLLNIIAGIDPPDAGTVRIAGTDLGTLREPALTLFRRRHIGFIFQSFNLLPTLTVAENVLLPLQLNGVVRGGADPLGARRIAALLERLGLADRHAAFPEELSGGERQRVAIARALVHQPDVVLADEPTGNLDLETGRQVITLLDDLVRDAGVTLVMATHSHEVIGRADRELQIRDGRIAAVSR